MSAGQKGTIPMFWHPQCSILLITTSVLTLSLSTKFNLRLIGELKSAITTAQAHMQEISKQKWFIEEPKTYTLNTGSLDGRLRSIVSTK